MTEVISHRFVHDFVAPATTQGKSAKHAHLWTRPRGHRTVLGSDSGRPRGARAPRTGVGAYPAPLRERRASQVALRPRRRPATPHGRTAAPRRRRVCRPRTPTRLRHYRLPARPADPNSHAGSVMVIVVNFSLSSAPRSNCGSWSGSARRAAAIPIPRTRFNCQPILIFRIGSDWMHRIRLDTVCLVVICSTVPPSGSGGGLVPSD
jgi:hypothetical protein